jgi:hypothetical protein
MFIIQMKNSFNLFLGFDLIKDSGCSSRNGISLIWMCNK